MKIRVITTILGCLCLAALEEAADTDPGLGDLALQLQEMIKSRKSDAKRMSLEEWINKHHLINHDEDDGMPDDSDDTTSGTDDTAAGTDDTAAGTDDTATGTDDITAGTDVTAAETEDTAAGTDDTAAGTDGSASDAKGQIQQGEDSGSDADIADVAKVLKAFMSAKEAAKLDGKHLSVHDWFGQHLTGHAAEARPDAASHEAEAGSHTETQSTEETNTGVVTMDTDDQSPSENGTENTGNAPKPDRDDVMDAIYSWIEEHRLHLLHQANPDGQGDSQIPTGDTSAGDTPAGDTPAGETTAGDTPARDTAAGDTAAGDTPAGDTAAGDAPAGETPAGDISAVSNENAAPDTTGSEDVAGVSDAVAGEQESPNEPVANEKKINVHDWLVQHNILPNKTKVETSAQGSEVKDVNETETNELSHSAAGDSGTDHSNKLNWSRQDILSAIDKWLEQHSIGTSSESNEGATGTDPVNAEGGVNDNEQPSSEVGTATGSENTEQSPATGSDQGTGQGDDGQQETTQTEGTDQDAATETETDDTAQTESDSGTLPEVIPKGAILEWIREHVAANHEGQSAEDSDVVQTAGESQSVDEPVPSPAVVIPPGGEAAGGDSAIEGSPVDSNSSDEVTEDNTVASNDASPNVIKHDKDFTPADPGSSDETEDMPGWSNPSYGPPVECSTVKTRDSAYQKGSGATQPNNTPFCGTSTMQSKINNMLSNLDSLVNAGRVEAPAGPEPGLAEFPWVVAIGEEQVGQECGGSLIDRNWVLTAAHCFSEELKPCDYIARIGVHDINDNVMTHVDIRASQIIVHPDYKGEKTYPNDIALLKLSSPAPILQSNVNTLCLPSPDDDFQRGQECFVTGWDKHGDGTDDEIMSIRVPLKKLSACWRYRLKYGLLWINEQTHMCAGFSEIGDRNSCQADTGGALFCRLTEGGPYVQAGVVVGGDGCMMTNWPGLYTNVKHYVPWINDVRARFSPDV